MLIIHGDNELASRALYLSLKDQAKTSGKQLVDFRGQSMTLPDLTTALDSISLLGSTNSVFIENFFTRRVGAEKTAISKYLESHPKADIITWDNQDISTSLKSFVPTLIKKFDLPKYIFQFIDNWSIDGLIKALTSAAPEQILALLAKRLHDLLLIKSNSGTFPPWQLAKLKSQSAYYALNKLTTMNFELLQIDYAQKTSSPPYDLSAALQFWLASQIS